MFTVKTSDNSPFIKRTTPHFIASTPHHPLILPALHLHFAGIWSIYSISSYSASLNLQITSFSCIINYKSLPELRLIIHFCNLYDLCLEKKRASLEIICDECFIFANRKNIFTAININKR